MTKGTSNETADAMNLKKLEILSEQVRNGTYKWSDIRRQYVPKPGRKEKRPLGIPNFSDRIVQDAIRMVLMSIYEPIFQLKEVSHGSRPKRSTETAMIKLQRESKEMSWAIEGDIKGAFPNVDHKKLMEILRKKIADKKFLNLIESGLKHNIVFENTKEMNLLGTPQGGIASPILFNIYMHEFDLFIEELIGEYLKLNKEENRTKSGRKTKTARRISSRIEKAWKKIDDHKFEKKLTKKERENIRNLTEITRSNKKELLKVRSLKENSLLIRFAYVRYVDDWILITNGPERIATEIKSKIAEWLTKELKLTLDPDKTLITNLKKDKSKFLGFTIYHKKKRIVRKISKKSGKTFTQRSTVPLTIGIDHDRVRNRLIAGKVLTKALKPRSNLIYVPLIPVDIVTKYKQRLEGLTNYYYHVITYPNELNFYHYIYKFSCLKTLARRIKKSIRQITIQYGEELKIERTTIEKTLKGEKEYTQKTNFPTLANTMKKAKEKSDKKKKIMFGRLKKHKEYLETVESRDVINYTWIINDPFSYNNIVVNLRTLYKLKTHCCICGVKHSSKHQIEMHHIKHIRKGKVSGFSQVMKNLNRKTLPTCRPCHNKIHMGTYDGYSLKSLFDTIIIEA